MGPDLVEDVVVQGKLKGASSERRADNGSSCKVQLQKVRRSEDRA